MPLTLPSPEELAEQLAGLDTETLRQMSLHLADHARAVHAGEVEGTDPNDVELLKQLRDAARLLVELAQREADVDPTEAVPAAARRARSRPSLTALSAAQPPAARPRARGATTHPRWQLADGRAVDFESG